MNLVLDYVNVNLRDSCFAVETGDDTFGEKEMNIHELNKYLTNVTENKTSEGLFLLREERLS